MVHSADFVACVPLAVVQEVQEGEWLLEDDSSSPCWRRRGRAAAASQHEGARSRSRILVLSQICDGTAAQEQEA